MTEQEAKDTIFRTCNKLRDEAYATHIVELVEQANLFEEACNIMDNAWEAPGRPIVK